MKLLKRKSFWVVSAVVAGVGAYLAFGVFGLHTLFYDRTVNEAFAADGPEPPRLVAEGAFHSVVHDGAGDARVYRMGDGSYALRLENLDVFNGPDLHVYAVAAADANDSDTVDAAETLNLGKLKGNKGNQTYALPDEFDPARFRSITVWCKRFGVNFATAPLVSPDQS